MLTGRRRSEVFGLKWSNVRPELNGVTYKKTKNGKGLRTPLGGPAWGVLQAMRQCQLEGCDLVWHQQNGKPFYHTFKAHWLKIRKLAGLEDKKLRPHDLRHTFGSLLGAAHIGGPAIQSLVGHGDLKSTERYLHMGQYPGRMTVVLEELAHVAGLHKMVEAPGDERNRDPRRGAACKTIIRAETRVSARNEPSPDRSGICQDRRRKEMPRPVTTGSPAQCM